MNQRLRDAANDVAPLLVVPVLAGALVAVLVAARCLLGN